jgi:uncharacterized damage-inducible protein DinB
MTYYGAKQLADSYRTVRKNTIAIAEEIPEAQYGFKATPDVMSVAEMLAHIAVVYDWQIDIHRAHVSQIEVAMFVTYRQQGAAAQAALKSKAEIIQALRDGGERFAAFMEGLSEATLAETVSFPPPMPSAPKTRFEMLLGVKEHEMHHRGQLMLVQRLLGQVPHLTRARAAMQAQRAGTTA